MAIDGKTVRRSKGAAKNAIHMVSAFAARQRLVLGQVKVADKANEIVAIRKLLDMLVIEGAVVTIDAMGCQAAIAQKIVDKKADYILALKGNQGALRQEVDLFVAEQNAKDFKDTTISRAETVDGDHGRVETRAITVIHDIDWLREQHAWPGLKSAIMVESPRELADKTERETRFYITSLVLLANQIAPLVRGHWAVENSLHWVLDMVFREDESRLRTDHAPTNFTTLKHMALNLIRRAKTKDSIRLGRKVAGWDDEFRVSLSPRNAFARFPCTGFSCVMPPLLLRKTNYSFILASNFFLRNFTMAEYVIRVEGVNFDQTLFDTSDLSTVRGSSLTLLDMPKAVAEALREFDPRPIFDGASLCAFRFDAPGDQEAKEARRLVTERLAHPLNDEPPHNQLSYVVDTARVGNGENQKWDPLAVAEARNKAAQLRSWSMPQVSREESAKDACTLDKMRPGVVQDPLRGFVSRSVYARRTRGRRARQGFWARIETETDRPHWFGYDFVDDFGQLVAAPPARLADQLRTKMAVVYADGNSFGARRSRAGAEDFSCKLKPLQSRLLSDIAAWLIDGAGDDPNAFLVVLDAEDPAHKHLTDRRALRFETLIWGGDEAMFVMPAWLVFDFVRLFVDRTKNWNIEGPLTHAIGVAIAHHKTPIRQLRGLVSESVERVKAAGLKGESSVTFDVFESQAPPDTSIDDSRLSSFVCGGANDAAHEVAKGLALPAAQFETALRQWTRLMGIGDGSLPRSQLYAALRAARQAGRNESAGLMGNSAQEAARKCLSTYAERAGRHNFTVNDTKLPALLGVSRPLAVDLALTAMLWDYIPPSRSAAAEVGRAP